MPAAPTAPPPPPGPVTLGLQGVALALGVVAILFTGGWGSWWSLLALAVAGVVGAAGLPLALWTARLHPALRHTYNAHFLVVLVGLLLSRLLPALGLFFETAARPALAAALSGLVTGAVGISLASVLASLGTTLAAQRSLAVLGLLGVLCAGAAALGAPVVAVFALAGLAYLFVRFDGPAPPPLSNAKQGLLGAGAYIGVNIVLVIPAGLYLAAIIAAVWQHSADGRPLDPIPGTAFGEFAGRLVLGTTHGGVAALAVWLWPQREPSRRAQGLGAVAVALAMGLAVGGPAGSALAVLPNALLLAVAGAAGAAALPRASRRPAVLMALMLLGYAGMNLILPDGTVNLRGHLLLFALEGIVIGGVGFAAYFGSILPKKPSGPALAPTAHREVPSHENTP